MKTKHRIKKAGTTVLQTFPEKKNVSFSFSPQYFVFLQARESETLRQETKTEQT